MTDIASRLYRTYHLTDCDPSHPVRLAADRIRTLEARIEETEGDARRYRWLRSNFVRVTLLPDALFWQFVGSVDATDINVSIDAAIDAALAGETK